MSSRKSGQRKEYNIRSLEQGREDNNKNRLNGACKLMLFRTQTISTNTSVEARREKE